MNVSAPVLQENMMNKVPEVTLLFWVLKIMSTTVGETAADVLNVDLGLGLTGTSFVMTALFAVVLFFQVRAPRYVPWLYWSTVIVISVLGTLITDNLTDQLNIPLALSTAAFSIVLLVVFAVWYVREKTLSIHHIDSVSRETFYWVAILSAFALGTAAGDWVSEGLTLGYGIAVLIFTALIVGVAFAHYILEADAVVCFWIAYVLTRPFGASLGDLLSQPRISGGLDFGAMSVNVVCSATIVVLVVYLSMKKASRISGT